jgi:hypothetical protein
LFDFTPVDSWIPFFFLYAEIHYKILKLPSRLFQRWPEIIADIPYRIEPGKKIPVLLIVKDADHYPVQLEKVWIETRNSKDEIIKIELLINPIFIDSSWWDQTIEIESPFEGEIWIDVFIKVKKKNKVKTFRNDNYKGSSHSSFKVSVATEKLPTFPNQYYGDLHCHSNYTSDQVEFGAPLKAIKKAAESLGLSFVAVTDHSYDLDDQPNNYLKNDPTLQKWQYFQEEIAELNNNSDKNSVYLIPGEEVSVANKFGRNVHFLVLNSTTFYEGYGDSAERWFRTRAKWTIKNLLDDLSNEALAIIPHPFVTVPALEYIFLRRGNIKKSDYQYDRIDGLQILNSSKNPAFFRGLENWKKQLLLGKRLYIYAGNDSHGNFNYYRQIKLPHWSLIEKDDYIFGKVKTVINVEKKLSLSVIVEALRNGQCYITDGPALNFTAIDKNGNSFNIGEKTHSNSCEFHISALSTSEFGEIKNITIFWGSLIKKNEIIYKTIQSNKTYLKDYCFSYSIKEKGYFRIEIETEKDNKIYNAYSNPIWVEPK